MGNRTSARQIGTIGRRVGSSAIKQCRLLILLLAAATNGLSQDLADSVGVRNTSAEIGVGVTATSNRSVPFWLRANQFGNIPPSQSSAAIFGSIHREYVPKKQLLDWGYGINGVLYAGNKLTFIPIEAYVKGRLGIFQLKAGRSKDISGIVDSTLSTGSYALSGNALGIPKVEISIPEFWAVPILGKLFAFKGAFSHGWMGKVPIQYGEFEGTEVKTYFHNASFHGRFGKPNWKLKLFAGFNHEVIWGSDKVIFGDQYNLSGVDAFWHVISGKKYTKHGLQRDISKIGNHLGSIDLALEYQTTNLTLLAYRQFFYEKGALAYLANAKDGLTGISLVNKSKAESGWQWQRILFELFYSKNQAGEANAKETPSGAEYYYNHAVYSEGYSYRGEGLGNPLITPARYARPDLPKAPMDFFINNRVIAYNLGLQGSAAKLSFLVKLTFSQNYGEYRTSDIPYWYNGDRYERDPIYGVFPKVNQFSGLLQVGYHMKNNIHVSSNIALDTGQLLKNSIGGNIKVSKMW